MTNLFKAQGDIFREGKEKAAEQFLLRERTDERKDDGPTRRNLYEEMKAMCELSAIIYTIAYLLDIIGKGGYPSSSSWWPFKKTLEQLHKTKLVMVQQCPDDGAPCSERLQKNIRADKVFEFIYANTEALSRDPEITGTPVTGEELVFAAMKSLKDISTDCFLWTVDHHFGETDLVYSLTVNRVLKRVTIAFRGSVGSWWTGNDWKHNLQIRMVELETPKLLKELGFTEKIKIHRGFKKYLLDADYIKEKPEKPPRKYGQILRDLQACYNFMENGIRVHDGFSLYVTGHSMGGALSTLLAMKLASSRKVKHVIKVPEPIINISIASPYVGGQAFYEAVQCLEKQNWLRHIRVSNEHDIVPVSPPPKLLWGVIYEPYKHTGINVHLIPGQGNNEIRYGNQKTFASQTHWNPWYTVEQHSTTDYWNRQKEDKENLETHTIAQLYKDLGPK